jgi:ankyrin repeat protein
MKVLLEHGAQVDAQNSSGYTALIYSWGDLQKTRILLDHGANVKLVGSPAPPQGGEVSALIQAASRKGGAATVRALLAKGADVRSGDRVGSTALHAAAAAGDLETVRLLIGEGADVNVPSMANIAFTPLMTAAMNRQTGVVKLLLSKGAKANAATPKDKPPMVKNGPIDLGGETALHLAAPYGPPELVKALLDAGADINVKNIQGMTPLMWAVASEYQNPEIIRMLLARGADPKIKSRDGQTALDLAKRLGASAGIELLGGTVEKPVSLPVKTEGAADARTALMRGQGILDRWASSSFLQSGGCVACHAQDASQLSASSATKVVQLNSEEAAKRVPVLKTGLETIALQGASGEALLFMTEALGPAGDLPERVGDYVVASLAGNQREDGSWHGTVPRTPIQDGDFTLTALSVRALARFAPPAMRTDVARMLEKSRAWFLRARPVSTEGDVMRMLGLAAAGASRSDVRKAAQALLDAQRSDGGWSQRKELSSDAYATGMTLWALADAGQLKPSDEAYKRGVKFLVGTQAPDGSWFVKSRAVIRFQPYFESGFPYEHDQWISSMATGWATKALAIGMTAPTATAELR